jgi:hypothetical protein
MEPYRPQPPPMMPPGHQQQPPPSPRRARRPLLLAGAIGLVVGAGAVGAIAATRSDGKASTKGPAVLTQPLSLPTTFPGFVRVADLAKIPASLRSSLGRKNDETVKSAASAYGGASVAAESYSNPDLGALFFLVAVRASTPQPWVPFEDAARLGIVKPQHEVVTFGEVGCIVLNTPTPVGKTPADDSVSLVSCQRSDPTLTVVLADASHDLRPSDAADVVNEAFDKLKAG